MDIAGHSRSLAPENLLDFLPIQRRLRRARALKGNNYCGNGQDGSDHVVLLSPAGGIAVGWVVLDLLDDRTQGALA